MALKHLLLFLLPVIVDALSLENVNEEWYHFKLKYNRTYKYPDEENYR